MPFIPAVNTARVTMTYSQFGQRMENVFYVQSPGAWTEASLISLVDVFEDWNSTSVIALQSLTVTLIAISARDLTVQEGPTSERGVTVDNQGVIASAAMPGNVTLAIKFNTGLAGRSRRGRKFVIGLTDAACDGNQVLPGTRDNWLAAYDALLTAISAAGFELVVASFYKGTDVDGDPVPRVTALLTPVTGFTADENLDSQRRRLTGRGV